MSLIELDRNMQWHKWFCWYPLEFDHPTRPNRIMIIWLRTIERRWVRNPMPWNAESSYLEDYKPRWEYRIDV